MNYVVYKYLMISSMVGGVACMAAILAYSFRGVLRRLLEKWLKLGPVGRMLSLLFFTVGILFGGSKNGVQGLGTGEEVTSGQWLVVREEGLGLDGLMGKRNPFRLGEEERFLFEDEADRSPLPLCVAPSQTTYQAVTSWSSRGAFCDWTRVEFPDSFAFPVGTNLISGVTVMAYGEVRESLRDLPGLFTLPAAVSLEPGVSAFSYGLTVSNSYVFAWTDCCVEREATNRVDASIELFRNGDAVVRFGESVTNIVAALPDGYVGEGQDNDWARAAFSADEYAAITNKGYEAWLDEDYVGVNQENGCEKAMITVHSLPDNGEPCYLVCGQHKVVVKEPGTYSFPIRVFQSYKVRTYPVNLPLTIETDDGYRDETEMMRVMSRKTNARSPEPPADGYEIYKDPRLVIVPSVIPYNEANGAIVRFWCNVGNTLEHFVVSTWTTTRLIFRGSREIEIVHAEIGETIWLNLHSAGHYIGGVIYIDDPNDGNENREPEHHCCAQCCGDYCSCDGECCDCRCGCFEDDDIPDDEAGNER